MLRIGFSLNISVSDLESGLKNITDSRRSENLLKKHWPNYINGSSFTAIPITGKQQFIATFFFKISDRSVESYHKNYIIIVCDHTVWPKPYSTSCWYL